MANSNLPERPSLERLKKLAKNRLQDLRRTDPEAKLATALLDVAREHGFKSWRALKAQIDDIEQRYRAKKIASPLVKSLPVSDLDRSAAFYRDLLGFEVKEQHGRIEASLGPARILFEKKGPSSGPAILFIESDDVESAHSAIRSRGGSPSDIQRVNWIKMLMFEIRDPDDNILWFGKSYHKNQDSPSRRASQPRGLRQALPELPFDNVPAAVTYYREALGFQINHQQDDLGVMDRDAITVLLITRTEHHKGIGSFYAYVEDADALHQELLAKGARILGPPISHPWGLRDFTVVDAEGNRIRFGQTFE